MRRQSLALAVVALIGVVSLVVTASTVKRRQSFSLGVVPGAVVATLRPGAELCEGPIDVADDFARVAVTLGTFRRPGPALDLAVRDTAGRTVLARGRLAGGYADNVEQEVRTSPVPEGSQVSVCITNRGAHSVAAYGAGEAAHLASTASVDGHPAGADVAMRFFFDRPRSLLRLAPSMVDRATLFAPAWLSAGMLWALFGLVAIAVPGLLTYAVARGAGPPPPVEPPER